MTDALTSSMQSIRRILCPIDLSPASRSALDFAAALAKPLGAGVELLYVWHPPTLLPEALIVFPPKANGRGVTIEQLARDNADACLKDARATLQALGVETHVHIGVGDPAREIVALADSAHFDLVVMGTRGRGGLAHALLGSVAEKVVRHARCPVITVRHPEEPARV